MRPDDALPLLTMLKAVLPYAEAFLALGILKDGAARDARETVTAAMTLVREIEERP